MTTRSFRSALGPPIAAYVAIKVALGRRYAAETATLSHLDSFLAEHAPGQQGLSHASFAAWSLTLAHLTPTVRRNRMRIVRNLCLYLQREEPGCFIPDINGFPAPHQPRLPHIFTEEQISRLLTAATNLRPPRNSPLRPEVLRLAIVLLYTAGLRRGELVRLVLSDYDPVERTLLIRASKFHKSRLVALSRDATCEIERYLRARCRLPHDADSPLLVHRVGGLRAYWGASLGAGLRDLFRKADVHAADGRCPRVHDTRHTYAVHVLLHWYRTGLDVQSKLPALATAMGHVSIASTAHYLALLDPVKENASELFAQHCRPIFDSLPNEGGGQ